MASTPTLAPPRSPPNNSRQNHHQNDLKRAVWVALLAVVMYTTVSFDRTIIDLYRTTMSTRNSVFFQGNSALFFGSNNNSATDRQDWHTELLALTGAFQASCPPGHALWHTNSNSTMTPPYR